MNTLVTRLLVTYPGSDCTQPLLDHSLMTIYSLSQKPVVRASVVSSPHRAGAQGSADSGGSSGALIEGSNGGALALIPDGGDSAIGGNWPERSPSMNGAPRLLQGQEAALPPTCVEEIAEVSRVVCPHALQSLPAVG